MDGWDNPKVQILRLVRSWLCDESNGRWVMIVDNADDSGVFFPHNKPQTRLADNPDREIQSLSDFLPQSPNGSILITSRSRDVAFRLTGSYTDIVSVDPMNKEHALTLVRNKLQGSFAPDDAAALVEALDYMPLAITQAIAYINQRAPRATVSRYLQDLRRGDRDRAKLLDMDIGDFRRDGTASNSIISTWQISFEHIHKTKPSAARLLSLMSLFDPQGIPESLLDGRYQENDDASSVFEDDLMVLIGFSLVTDVGASQFGMHRLVQFSTKRWLELTKELEEWKEKYVRLMNDSYPVGEHENWAVCQALFPHTQAVVWCRPTDAKALETWASVLFKASWYAREMGSYGVAKEMVQGALEAREATLAAEHPSTLASVNNLGLVLDKQGKYKEAEAMHQRALQGYEKVLGLEHPDTLTSVDNLGSVLNKQGKYKEAEEIHRRALQAREKVLGPEHLHTLTSVNSLGLVLDKQGKYEEAEEMHRRVLQAREKMLGPEHPDTLTTIDSLGSVLKSYGKYKEAEAMHRRALQGYEKVLGPEHPDTLTSVNRLGTALARLDKYKEAEAMHRRALQGYEKVLGPEHPDTLIIIGRLGSALAGLGKNEEAEAMRRRALQGFEKVLGPEHPYTLTSVNSLGSTLESQGKYKEAEAMYRRVLQAREKVLGPEHPHTLTSVSYLGSILESQGKDKEAEAMHRRALQGFEKVLGPEHPYTLNSANDLGSVLARQGKYTVVQGGMNV